MKFLSSLSQKIFHSDKNVTVIIRDSEVADEGTIFGVFSSEERAREAIENESLDELGINYTAMTFVLDYRNKNRKPKYWRPNGPTENN